MCLWIPFTLVAKMPVRFPAKLNFPADFSCPGSHSLPAAVLARGEWLGWILGPGKNKTIVLLCWTKGDAFLGTWAKTPTSHDQLVVGSRLERPWCGVTSLVGPGAPEVWWRRGRLKGWEGSNSLWVVVAGLWRGVAPGWGLRTKQRQGTALSERERDGEKLSAGITCGASLPGQVCASH